jgi:hypothetical protein
MSPFRFIWNAKVKDQTRLTKFWVLDFLKPLRVSFCLASQKQDVEGHVNAGLNIPAVYRWLYWVPDGYTFPVWTELSVAVKLYVVLYNIPLLLAFCNLESYSRGLQLGDRADREELLLSSVLLFQCEVNRTFACFAGVFEFLAELKFSFPFGLKDYSIGIVHSVVQFYMFGMHACVLARVIPISDRVSKTARAMKAYYLFVALEYYRTEEENPSFKSFSEMLMLSEAARCSLDSFSCDARVFRRTISSSTLFVGDLNTIQIWIGHILPRLYMLTDVRFETNWRNLSLFGSTCSP